MELNKFILRYKWIIASATALLVISVIIGVVLINRKGRAQNNPYVVIPTDASIILRINNYKEFSVDLMKKNRIWISLKNIPPFNTLTDNIQWIDSVSKAGKSVSSILDESRIFISGHYIGGRKSDFLTVISMNTERGEKNIIDVMQDVLKCEIKRNVRKYEGQNIYTIKKGRNIKANFYVSVVAENIIISRSVILIEKAIRQRTMQKTLLDDKGFSETLITAGKNKNANMFIDIRKFTSMASAIANDSFRQKLKDYKGFAEWVEFDINLQENQTILNGLFLSTDSEALLIDIFRDSHPVKITVDQVLPAWISVFASFGIDKPDLVYKYTCDYLKTYGRASRDAEIQEINNHYGIKTEEVFLSIIDDEITYASGFTEKTENQQAKYVIIKCKSGSQAKKQLQNLTKQICRKKNISLSGLKHSYSIDNETSFEIIELPLPNITGLLLGGLFDMPDKIYYTLINNYLVFGQSVEVLGHFLYSNVLNMTLSNSQPYKKFQEGIAQKSYILLFTNLGRASSVLGEYLDSQIISTWEENYDIFQSIQPFGMQISEVSKMKYCNILLQFIDEYKGKPQTIWESLLDTSFTMKPQLVQNHITQKNEIIVQDLKNKLYLLNQAGRILWKQTLSEQINSKIYQVDYFRNGKLQFLFSTRNYLHLIDRNGNYVERYPVRLRTEATAGMSLFDYEKSKDYRIFIPCADNKVYAYTIDGAVIEGWQFPGSDYPVERPISHFRLKDKDFIVFGDKYRTYILDRKGLPRVNINEIFPVSKKNIYYLDDKESIEQSRLLITDTTGNIVWISFDGNVTTTQVGKFSKDHFFDFKDVDADGEKDFIFVDQDKIMVFRQDKSLIFEYTFNNRIMEKPVYFHFSYADRKLGLVDSRDQKIYLLNNDGSLYKGFPLEGNTLFSVGYLDATNQAFNLVVGGRNNFLYNYAVK